MSRGGDIHTLNIFGDGPKKRPLPPGGIYTSLVAMTFISGAEERLAHVRAIGIVYLVIDRHYENTKDPNAIRLLLPGAGNPEQRSVGYLSADLAARLAAIVDAGEHHMRCRVEAVTGGVPGKKHYGVNVALYCVDGFDLLPYHPRYKWR
jgi:hypothetical protein